MAGHRRISTDLFLAHLDRDVPRSKVEALLELDFDDYRGTRGSIKGYARLWGWSRDKVRKLVSEYDNHLDDLKNGSIRGEIAAPPKRHLSRHPSDTPSDTQESMNPDTCESGPTPLPTPDRPPVRHSSDTFLEQEQEQEGREGSTPKASPRGIGASSSRRKQSEHEIELALEKAPEESRGTLRARLVILAEFFLACGRVADEAQLRAYCRTTAQLPAVILKAACDEARATNENPRGFAPSEATIIAVGKRLEQRARKRANRGNA